MAKMQIKEALFELRKAYDKIIGDYESIIFAQAKELNKQDLKIAELENKEEKRLSNGE